MGLFSSIGNMLNDITGATSAQKANYKQQKEFAKNAHQWEVEDLKKAGLNPVLSAGGNGASAGGSGGSTNSSGVNPIEMAINGANGIASAFKTSEEAKLAAEQTRNTEQDTLLKEAQTLGYAIDNATRGNINKATLKELQGRYDEIMAKIANMNSQTVLNHAQTAKNAYEVDNIIADTAKKESETAYNKRRASGKSFNAGVSGYGFGTKGFGFSANGGGTW